MSYIKNFYIVALILLLFSQSIVWADIYFDDRVTQKEQVAFAFFRASQTPPDYERWITENPKFEDVPVNLQKEYILKEMLRLGHGYADFDLEKDVIEVEVATEVRYIQKDSDESLVMQMQKIRGDDIPIFNFSYLPQEVFSLAVDDVHKFYEVKIPFKNMDTVKSVIPHANKWSPAKVKLYIRVMSADSEKPLDEDGMKRWMMGGKVAYIQCNGGKDSKGEDIVFWDYVAPWYAEIHKEKTAPEIEKYPHPFDLKVP